MNESVGEGESRGRRDVLAERMARMKSAPVGGWGGGGGGGRGGSSVHGAGKCCSNATTAALDALKEGRWLGFTQAHETHVEPRGQYEFTAFTRTGDVSSSSPHAQRRRPTMGVLVIAALLLRVRLAVAVGYILGSAPGQDSSP